MQVLAYDFGIKHNILRRLASFGCRITVVPASFPAEEALALDPDGIFLSNGPVRIPPPSIDRRSWLTDLLAALQAHTHIPSYYWLTACPHHDAFCRPGSCMCVISSKGLPP